jgi:hypothetical protein
MTKALVLYVVIVISLGSCTQRLVCPAYQSAFIYDKPTQREKFVYYNESPTTSREITASNSKTITLPPRDSAWAKSTVLQGPALPQVRRVKKDRYLLLPEKTYKQAMRSLQTVEMKQILPKKPDSLDVKSELDSAARSISDTLTAAGASPKAQQEEYAITKTKEKYNLDQDIYMWYFRDVLVMPDVRAARMEKKDGGKATGSEKSAKAPKQGLFKRLFGKKDKTKSEVVNDSTQTQTKSKKVKEKKAPKPSKKDKAAAKEEKKKEETPKKEEDDGF